VDAEGRTVRFADHSLLEDVGVVVWATGYRPDDSWLHTPGVVGEGHVVHQRGVTDVPGLYFLGLPWQHTRGSALTTTDRPSRIAVAGRRLARVLRGVGLSVAWVAGVGTAGAVVSMRKAHPPAPPAAPAGGWPPATPVPEQLELAGAGWPWRPTALLALTATAAIGVALVPAAATRRNRR
jgi:hypothetical protein